MKRIVLLRHGESLWNKENRRETANKRGVLHEQYSFPGGGSDCLRYHRAAGQVDDSLSP